ncbi:hypothetical protein H6504_02310 [Candidatus Woesearchaeota archaeon]|nr:hypothetical protein [Candidatus Woesearchaeota archaeon]
MGISKKYLIAGTTAAMVATAYAMNPIDKVPIQTAQYMFVPLEQKFDTMDFHVNHYALSNPDRKRGVCYRGQIVQEGDGKFSLEGIALLGLNPKERYIENIVGEDMVACGKPYNPGRYGIHTDKVADGETLVGYDRIKEINIKDPQSSNDAVSDFFSDGYKNVFQGLFSVDPAHHSTLWKRIMRS